MGGCATKPKVLKGDQEGEMPAPEAAKEEAAAPAKVTSETKEVVVVDDKEGDNKKVEGDCGGEITKVKEPFEDAKADDQENKSPSLSNLVKIEEGQEVKQDDVNASTVKEPKEAEKAKEESEIKQIGVNKSEISVEHSPPAEFVDAPEKSDSEKTPRVATTKTNQSSEKTDGDETESSKKKTQDAIIRTSEIKPEDNLKSSEIKTEGEKPSEEKKTEETK